MQILEVFDFIKSKSQLDKEDQTDSVNLLARFVSKGLANPTDAYVLMDFMEKVFGASRKKITDATIKHIESTGDMSGLGVDLTVARRNKNDYSVDKSWRKYEDQIDILKDLKSKREKELADEVKEAQDEGKKPPIPTTQIVYIRPKYE
tara:strand:+ start:226 stop:669 length:444 start_codon:yes stop_codon:yes gene_type:complete